MATKKQAKQPVIKRKQKAPTPKTARRKRVNLSDSAEPVVPMSMAYGSAFVRQDGSHKGRAPGPNKSTIEIRNRLAELKCDPLEFAVMFLRGQESPCTHPFLGQLKAFFFQLRKYKNKPPPESLIAHFELKANVALGPGTWLDPKIRARIATDLLSYMYPRLQAVQYSAGGHVPVDPEKPLDDLTDDELKQLAIDITKAQLLAQDLKTIGGGVEVDELKNVGGQDDHE